MIAVCSLRSVVLVAVVVALPCCSTPEPAPLAEGFGRLGPEVFELNASGDPAGELEFEVDSEGRIFEAEATIRPEDLPAAIRRAASSHAGDRARMIAAEIEYSALGRTYEVAFERDGRECQFVLDAEGRVLEEEFAISRGEAPPIVLDRALRRLPGSLRSVDRQRCADGSEFFHVKTAIGTAHYKAIVTPEGEIIRAVREARAEIELPLSVDVVPFSIDSP